MIFLGCMQFSSKEAFKGHIGYSHLKSKNITWETNPSSLYMSSFTGGQCKQAWDFARNGPSFD